MKSWSVMKCNKMHVEMNALFSSSPLSFSDSGFNSKSLRVNKKGLAAGGSAACLVSMRASVNAHTSCFLGPRRGNISLHTYSTNTDPYPQQLIFYFHSMADFTCLYVTQCCLTLYKQSRNLFQTKNDFHKITLFFGFYFVCELDFFSFYCNENSLHHYCFNMDFSLLLFFSATSTPENKAGLHVWIQAVRGVCKTAAHRGATSHQKKSEISLRWRGCWQSQDLLCE